MKIEYVERPAFARFGKPGARIAVLAALVLSSCGREPERHSFTESTPATSPAAMPSAANRVPMMSAPPASVKWTAPAEWAEKPGQGMRLATFAITNAQGAAECAVSSLAGNGGGLAANVQRWAGQIGLTLGAEPMKVFVDGLREEKTADGHSLRIVDFSTLPAPEGAPADAPSMLAAVISRDHDTVFLKLQAPRALITLEKDRFVAVAKSVQ